MTKSSGSGKDLPRLIRAALARVDAIVVPMARRGAMRDGQPEEVRARTLAAAPLHLRSHPDLLVDHDRLDDWAREKTRVAVCGYWREHRTAMKRRSTRMAMHMLGRNALASYRGEARDPWDVGLRAARDAPLRALPAAAQAAWVWRRIDGLGPNEIAFRLRIGEKDLEALFIDTIRAMREAALDYWNRFDGQSEARMRDQSNEDLATPAERAAQDALLAHYCCDAMSDPEAEAFLDLLAEDEEMFERMAPVLDFWTSELSAAEQEINDRLWVDVQLHEIHRVPLERRAVLVTPRQPYYEWLATLAAKDMTVPEFRAADATRWPRLFLTPCHLGVEETERYIDDRMPQLFEALLEIVDRRDAWPADRSAAAFHQWFTVAQAEDVDDLVSEMGRDADDSEN